MKCVSSLLLAYGVLVYVIYVYEVLVNDVCHLPTIIANTSAYKPVVIIHGLRKGYSNCDILAKWIRHWHSGTEVFNLDRMVNETDTNDVRLRVDNFRRALVHLASTFKRPQFHLIGYSEGGLIARGVIQSWPNHTVSNFISLSSPQAGQFVPYHLLYELGLDQYHRPIRAVATPYQYLERPFARWNNYLFNINNRIEGNYSAERKEAITRLNKLVLIGGEDDRVIDPWQSSLFGFYDDYNPTTIFPLSQRRQYTEDLIGLRTLDQRKELIIKTFAGIRHENWCLDPDVFDRAILPYLD